MSATLAIAAVSLLHVALLAPLALAALRSAAVVPITIAYGALLCGTAAYQTGLLERTTLPSLETPDVTGPALTDRQCAEVLTLFDQSGVIIDRRTPPRLVVAETLWAQVPQELQEPAISCVQRTWPRDAPPAEVEIIAR